MSSLPTGISLGIFFVFVAIPLILIASISLYLQILDERRRVSPRTLRRIH
jgi:hypothetical protein